MLLSSVDMKMPMATRKKISHLLWKGLGAEEVLRLSLAMAVDCKKTAAACQSLTAFPHFRFLIFVPILFEKFTGKKTMQIVCPTCNAAYKISESKIPEKGAKATCKKCGGKIVVKPLASSVPTTPARPVPDTGQRPDNVSEMALFSDYPELRGFSAEKFDYQTILAANKQGGYKTRRNNFKLKILSAVHETLDKMLQQGEKVLCVGKGIAFYPAEMIFGNGYLTRMYNHYALVGTSKRLLFVNINGRIKHATHYLFQMPYENIKKVKGGLFSRSLALNRVKGKRRVFTGIKGYLSKELKAFVQKKLHAANGAQGVDKEPPESLCPSCFVPLGKGMAKCPQCNAAFKEPKKALLRSLLLPGWGDMYLGHRALGLVELAGSAAVWSAVIASVLGGQTEMLAGALIILVFYNGVDALLTRHMANKGYMLA